MATTGHESEIINVQDLKASLQKLKSTHIANLVDIESLPSDYTFKVNDRVVLNGVLYKCTSATANTPFTLLVQDGKLLYNTINGQKCYMVSSTTLNSGWAKVTDIDDKYYIEERLSEVNSKIDKEIGVAYGTCTTAGGTAAKTVTVPSFRLAVNRAVSVLFTNAFAATSPTLNVNGTGAKAIKYFGEAIAPGKVRDNTILNMAYDGTAWNVFSITSLAGTPSMAVDLGLPSGLLWCDRNVGAAAPEEGGLVFSWGNVTGYEDGGTNPNYHFTQENYNSSPAASLSADLSLAYDAARQNLGAPWRMPSEGEIQELLDNTTQVFGSLNGIDGFYFTSPVNGNSIFIPKAWGYIEGNIINKLNIWSSTLSTTNSARMLREGNSYSLSIYGHYRWHGLHVRAVM